MEMAAMELCLCHWEMEKITLEMNRAFKMFADTENHRIDAKKGQKPFGKNEN